MFCATIDGYDADHHMLMLHDNPELTHFAVFGVDALAEALQQEFLKNHIKPGFPTHISYFLAAPIVYGTREFAGILSGGEDLSNSGVSEDEYERTVFYKPERFEEEREIRFVARLNLPEFAPLDAKPVFPKSLAIRKSMGPIGNKR